MSYFKLALAESEEEAENTRGFRDDFLRRAAVNMRAEESDSDTELYSRHKEEYEGTRKKVRQMTFFLGVAVVLIVLMATLLVWQHFIRVETPCVSAMCVEAGGYIAAKMNFSANPCNDFYNYACGGWLANTYPPPDKAKWSTFSSTYQQNSAVLKHMLEVKGSNYMGEQSTSVAKTKKYFHLCMNLSAVEERGATPALKLIKELGSWTLTSDPVSGQWVESNWKPMDTILKVHGYNHNALFGMGVAIDSKNSSSHIIKFYQSGLTLSSREEYLKDDSDKFHQAFLDYGEQFIHLLGGDNNTRSKMEEIYQLEKQLAQIFVRQEELIDPVKVYHKMTVEDFQTLMGPSINLDEYLRGIFGTEIPQSETIIISTPEYFRKLGPILQNTTPEVFVNYLIWSLLQALPGFLPYAFSKAALRLERYESGITELSPQWLRCVSKTDTSFGFATGALFVEDPKRFNPKTKTQIEDMLLNIRDQFVEDLPTVDWMTETVRSFAVDKAKAVERKVAYPEWIRSPTKLDQYYQQVEIVDEFFESMLNLRKFYQNKNIQKLGNPPNPDIWSQTPSEVNAYYSSSHNFFAFPAGILQRPYYDPSFPLAFNYGSMGFIMGHELTHGFDNTGRQYDKFGNLYNWWDNRSSQAFTERSQCLIDQYDSYQIQGQHVKGERTLGENIADIGGLKMAYKSYLKQQDQQDSYTRKQLPGLPPEDAKLFFIGFAQVWCSFYTPAYAQTALLTDSHSPAKYRVIGTLSSSTEFSDVFGCRRNIDAMNPENKCQVW